MKNHWRRIIFFVFALGFVIAAPLIVLYTAGYRYQFGTLRIVKTGILSIASYPKGATVYLDGIKSNKKTPAVIDNLFPREVKVRVEKDGYSSWEKTLEVNSGQTTFVSNLVLYEISDAVAFVKENIQSVYKKNSELMAYIKTDKDGMEIHVRNNLDNRIIFTKKQRATSIVKLSWSPDAQYILLDSGIYNHVYSVIRVSDATEIKLPFTSTKTTWWDIGSSHQLFYQSPQKTLKTFGMDFGGTIPVVSQAQTARRFENKLLVVQSNKQAILSSVDDKGVSLIIAYLPLGDYEFVDAPSPLIGLMDFNRHKLILVDINQKNIVFNNDVTNRQWSQNNDRMIWSSGFDVNIFSRDSGTSEIITRVSEPITDIAWYKIGDEILYSQKNSIKAIELDRRNKRNEITLVDGYSIKSFWLDSDGTNLYFFGNKSGEKETQIFKLRLQK